MKPVTFTVVYHNRTAEIRMTGKLFSVVETTNDKRVTRYKLLTETEASRVLGSSVVDQAITYGENMMGVTINVKPVQIEI